MRDAVSYTNDIRPVVKNFCLTCHAGAEPEAELLLTSYALVREETELGELLQRINDAHEPMPEDGLMPLQMRRLFQQWADGDFVNIGAERPAPVREYDNFEPAEIVPLNVNQEGFDLLEKLQGHWIGPMRLMGRRYDWMTFDYRAIAPSHVHGIFEGGTIGNLFTSFFVTDFQGQPTIMARNGGLLNGIYRTSYFVLTRVKRDWRKTTYELVDARGGKDVMSMTLEFAGDRMTFTAYTSRMGLREPTLHMRFEGTRNRSELAEQAANAVGFPRLVQDFPMPDPFPVPTWIEEFPWTSATYLAESDSVDDPIEALGEAAKDPRRIDQMPYLGQLTVPIRRSVDAQGHELQLYLSLKPIVDHRGQFLSEYGYPKEEGLDSIVSFPRLHGKADKFTFTYLHPGRYFLTIFADVDGDGIPSAGDITHPAMEVEITPETHHRLPAVSVAVINWEL